MAFAWGAYMNDGKKRLYLELGRAPIHLSEMVRRQESHARFTDDLREGKLNMLFNRNPGSRPATRLGRIFLAGFLAVVVAATTVAQTSRNVPDVTAMSMEVIRGAGGTLWGANAVDGVINVITKKAKSTQATVVTAGAGTEERAAGGARYGSKLGDNTYYRAYAKYFDWGPSAYPSGMTAHDGWDALRGGFRADWTPAGANSLTVQGDIYRSRFDETLTVASLSAPYSNTFPNDGKYS